MSYAEFGVDTFYNIQKLIIFLLYLPFHSMLNLIYERQKFLRFYEKHNLIDLSLLYIRNFHDSRDFFLHQPTSPLICFC